MIQAVPGPPETAIEIPPEYDPRLIDSAGKQRQRLGQLSPTQRAALILDCYPELRVLPGCDWERMSARTTFSILCGETSRHFAHLELALLAGSWHRPASPPTTAWR